jgi:hypothetical protein
VQFRKQSDRAAEAFARAIEMYAYDGILVNLDTATPAANLRVLVETARAFR